MSDNFSIKVEIEAGIAGAASVKKFSDSLAKMLEIASKGGDSLNKTGDAAKKTASGFGEMAVAMSVANLASSAIIKGLDLLKASMNSVVKESAMLAARYETMGVVMGVVGNNTGYTRKEMDAYAKSLEKSGISMIASRESLTKMAQAHLDLSKAQGLARLAQDAAVIGNINSSQAFETMIYGIQSGQIEVLRTIGLNVQFESSYVRLAKTLGKSKESLTETERIQARFNEVMERAPDIAGAYEESMKTVGKQILSMPRYVEDLKVGFGAIFGGALQVGVQSVNSGLQDMKKYLDQNAIAAKLVRDNLEEAASNFVGIVKDILSMGEGVNDVVDGFSLWEILAGALNLSLAALRDIINAIIGFARAAFVDPFVNAVQATDKLLGKLNSIFNLDPPEWWKYMAKWAGGKDAEGGFKQMMIGVKGTRVRRFYNGAPEATEDGEAGYKRTPGALTEADKVAAAKAAEAAKKAAADKAARDKKIAAEADAIAKSNIAAELSLAKDAISRKLNILEQSFKDELVGIKAFYAEKQALQLAAIDAEIAAKRKELRTASTADRKKLETEIELLKRSREDVARENAIKERDAIEAARKASGEKMKAEFETAGKPGDRADAALASKLANLDRQEEMGKMGGYEANKQRVVAYNEWLAVMNKVIAAQEVIVEQSGDTDQLAALQALRDKIADVSQTVVVLKNEWASIQAAGAGAFASGMMDAFSSIGQGLGSLVESFRNMARNVASAIATAIQKVLLLKAAQAMLGGSAAGGNTWSQAVISAFKFSEGGSVQGPGTSTSDSIPAMLSTGEYVVRASAVRRLGMGFLDSLNGTRSRPSFAFADGGPVVGAVSPAPRAQTSKMEVGLEEGLLVKQMEGPLFEKKLIAVIARNPGALRSVLA